MQNLKQRLAPAPRPTRGGAQLDQKNPSTATWPFSVFVRVVGRWKLPKYIYSRVLIALVTILTLSLSTLTRQRKQSRVRFQSIQASSPNCMIRPSTLGAMPRVQLGISSLSCSSTIPTPSRATPARAIQRFPYERAR